MGHDQQHDHDTEFETFVRARHRDLLRFAYLLTGDWEPAQDLMQQALTGAYAGWRRIREDPERYVRRSLVNTRTSWWRRRWRGERPTGAVPDLPDARDPVRDVDERDAVWRALRAVPKGQRAVLVLRYYEDRSDAEIASLLGTAEGTVRSQAHRGLAHLRAELDRARRKAGPGGPPPAAAASRRDLTT